MANNLEDNILFDGGETFKKADQFVSKCDAGAVNLHLYKLGSYDLCRICCSQQKCKDGAYSAGMQAEL